ncbi:MAG: YfhO family protein [Acidimicrobiia bacterium]
MLGSKTLQTSTLAGIASTNGFNDILPNQERAVTTLRPDAGASAWQTEPWAKMISDAYRHGTWPLWNPYQGTGKPLAANTISAAFDPLSIPAFIRPSPRVADLSIVGAFCLGSMAMFLFLRSLRTRRAAALASAAVFSFGGYWFFNANNPFSRAYIYVPILLFLVNKAVDARIGPWTFALALGLAGSAVVGMPESTFLVLLAVGVYALYRLLTQRRARHGAAWLNLAVAGGLGLAMASPLIALFGEYQGLSFHTHKAGSTLGRVSDPTQYLVAWLAPNLDGTVTKAWVGGAALALAALCIAASPRFLRARQVLPFGVLTLFFVWKIYGLPGAGTFGGLPVVDQVKWVTFGLPVLQTLIAVMTGIGLDALLRKQIVPRRAAYVGVGFLALVTLLCLTNDQLRAAIQTGDGLRRLALALAGASAVGVGVVLTRSHARRGAVGLVVAIAVVAELVVLFPSQSFAPRSEPFVRQPWFQFVDPASRDAASEAGAARVFGLDGKLFPETASAVGIYDIRMLDALYVDRYYQFVKTFLDGRIYDRYVGINHSSPETGTQYVDNPMFDLLGVRYLLSGWSVPGGVVDDLAHRLPVAGTVSGTAVVAEVDLAGQNRSALVSTSGSTAFVPAPPAEVVAVRGQVANLTTTVPTTFAVVGERADGSQTVLGQVTAPPASPPQSVALDVSVPATAFTRIGFRVTSPDPDAKGAWHDLAFVDASGATMSSQYRFVGRDNLTSVWENLYAGPRAFIVNDVVKVADQRAARRTMLQGATKLPGGAFRVGDFDPFTTAVVEGDATVPTKVCATPASVSFTKYEPGEVRLEVDSPCPGLLVLSDTYYPGWTATVNGDATDVRPTDLAFRGVAVPAGRSIVVMRYQATHFRLALLVAALAFLAGIGIALLPLVRRRHAARETPPAMSDSLPSSE